MPKDTSSSSSEDETETAATKSPLKHREAEKKTTKYQCPSDFVPFCHKPCSSTLRERLKNKKDQLWLIKAPVSFNPQCFSGIKVPLSGLQTVKVPTAAGGTTTGSSQQIYSILASTHGTSELHLLTSDSPSSDAVVFGPTFSGLLNVCESYGDSSTNQAPQVIPAAPAPSIPPGLKQRFHPFGSKTPTLTCVADSEGDGAAFGPSSTTLRPLVVKRFLDDTGHAEEDEAEGRKKKKKKKKEKQVKTEREDEPVVEVVRVKEEPVSEIQDQVMMELPFQEGDVLEEKRKKKKKKKDGEREEVEQGVEPSVWVKKEKVKCEPIDSSYGDVAECSAKKKKKNKKTKTEQE
ncbi:DNA-directed RNA polymerase I subunit RPA34 A34.5 Anti-sense to ERCC-1 protein [Channa argus]|uniref:DNA-directed RNA polymerase I subunit RPA34 A34.5 Anti-sense to ERCC-1 protein n=1 Tax=Channa argus TaxID=215402 RepID=A0A6G1PT05_CHAAH|nr:DNA-directed RNA polymerase I subunit RPA34 A34.5 Anti-sense to ERCC-1 protein [Channa argus]